LVFLLQTIDGKFMRGYSLPFLKILGMFYRNADSKVKCNFYRFKRSELG